MMMSCDHFTCGVFISVKRKSLKKWIVRFRSAYTQQTVMPLKWNVFSLALLLVLLLYFGYSFTVFPFFCVVMQKVPLSFVPPYSVCLQQFSVCVCVCATVCTSASGVLTKAVTYDSTNKNLHVPSGLPLSFSTSNIHLRFQIEAPLITSLLLK